MLLFLAQKEMKKEMDRVSKLLLGNARRNDAVTVQNLRFKRLTNSKQKPLPLKTTKLNSHRLNIIEKPMIETEVCTFVWIAKGRSSR